MMIVIFAWWICLDGISKRRKIDIILILSLLDDPYHIVLKLQFQFSLPSSYLTADKMLLEAMDDTDNSDSSISNSSNMAAAASSLSAKPKPFSHGKLNNLARDLGLSKESSEILASRLGEHGILDSGTKITFCCDRDDLLIRFLIMENDFVYCNNIQGLLSEMGLLYFPKDFELLNNVLYALFAA